MIYILFLVESPFTQRDYERYGIEILRRNFQVIICDFAKWFHPDLNRKFESSKVNLEGIRNISSKKDFENLLGSLEASSKIAIDQLSSHPIAYWIRKKIKENNFKLTKVQNGLIPSSPTETDLTSHIKSKIISFSEFKKILIRYFFKLIPKPSLKPDIIVITGESGLMLPGVSEIPQKVFSHSFDFDLVLKSENKIENIIKEDYAVFLDEDMVHHADYSHLGLKSPIDEKDYYFNLNRFFDYLEEKLNLRVVWALHPRANYEKKMYLLKERRSYTGETLKLVANAKLVILHSSTSISFPVILRKPMLFITMKKLDESWIGPRIRHRASLFDQKAVKIDDLDSTESANIGEYELNEKCYRDFEDKYLKYPGTSRKQSWQIFSDYMNQHLN